MSWLGRLRGLFSRSHRPSTSSRFAQELHLLRAKIDAAQTTPENRRHWGNADSYSADAAYDEFTRSIVRNRSRYEALNNCYAKGAVRAYADDLIGTGPRPQVSMPTHDNQEAAQEAATLIERDWKAWSEEILFPIKLRLAEKSVQRCGGCFAVMDTNPNLEHPIKLAIRWLEDEQCGTPFGVDEDNGLVAGVRFDRFDNPIEYYFFRHHPGSARAFVAGSEYEVVPAERVVHFYSVDRFGQRRGLPELTPALPLYAQTRRLTLATLTAAEFAAMLAGVLETNQSVNTGEAPETVDAWSFFEMIRGALMSLPDGWKASQFKAEQPTTTYPDFKRELLTEMGRATNQPLNVVSGNSSGYNFSSGRLDHVPYQRGLRIDRNDFRLIGLTPIFREFVAEGMAIGLFPSDLPPFRHWDVDWNWDGFDGIDQSKEAQADDVRLKNGTQTYHETYAAYGQDWRSQFKQLAREKAEAERLGLPWPVLAGASSQPPAAPEDAVAMALAEAGASEAVIEDVLSQLQGQLQAVRLRQAKPSTNGHHWTGARGD